LGGGDADDRGRVACQWGRAAFVAPAMLAIPLRPSTRSRRTTGTVSWTLLINALYLAVIGSAGMYVAFRRLG
jgi:hypothetical protein